MSSTTLKKVVLIVRKYLADTNLDVRVATENLLAEFLREIKHIALQQAKLGSNGSKIADKRARQPSDPTSSVGGDYNESAIDDDDDDDDEHPQANGQHGEAENEWEGEGSGLWEPGQSVVVDYGAIMDIIVDHLAYPGRIQRLAQRSHQTIWSKRRLWTGF